jgi:hypothetical protein
MEKPNIYFYYGEDKHSSAIVNFIAENVKIIMVNYTIKQQKINSDKNLNQLRDRLVASRVFPPGKPLTLPFAIVNGKIEDASQFSRILKNMTIKKKTVTQPESVGLDDWYSSVIAQGDEDTEDIDQTSIAKKLDRFNKRRESRTTDKPVTKKVTKSYDNDEQFQADSGADNVNTAMYDFNSGENILEEMRLSDAIDAGKKDSNKPRRRDQYRN